MYGNPFGPNHVVSGGVPFMYIDIDIDIIIDIALKILPLVRYIPSDIPWKHPTKPIDIHLHHPKMLHYLFFQRKLQYIQVQLVLAASVLQHLRICQSFKKRRFDPTKQRFTRPNGVLFPTDQFFWHSWHTFRLSKHVCCCKESCLAGNH